MSENETHIDPIGDLIDRLNTDVPLPPERPERLATEDFPPLPPSRPEGQVIGSVDGSNIQGDVVTRGIGNGPTEIIGGVGSGGPGDQITRGPRLDDDNWGDNIPALCDVFNICAAGSNAEPRLDGPAPESHPSTPRMSGPGGG